MFGRVSDVPLGLLEDDGKFFDEPMLSGKSVTCCRELYLRVCELLESTCLRE
ncbi:hypothetical protein Plim_2521 [Planctopirus limnophila DSM 3776]|uniref:Uncharacterized protein n=1 Tax=Planctopirus limnophila (strain ATCC 43296 / DSM 3776 / IFAM 1008 / Mu 290) TaxID=521674 RepID=D5SPX2_PLAL2|nr:hypothetical protein Plim_2521 [Planctopirus limnophila DSM 3776]